jgi:hypothetical protein
VSHSHVNKREIFRSYIKATPPRPLLPSSNFSHASFFLKAINKQQQTSCQAENQSSNLPTLPTHSIHLTCLAFTMPPPQRFRNNNKTSLKSDGLACFDTKEKKACKRFQKTGSCKFGDDCWHSHVPKDVDTSTAKPASPTEPVIPHAQNDAKSRTSSISTIDSISSTDSASTADSSLSSGSIPPFVAKHIAKSIATKNAKLSAGSMHITSAKAFENISTDNATIISANPTSNVKLPLVDTSATGAKLNANIDPTTNATKPASSKPLLVLKIVINKPTPKSKHARKPKRSSTTKLTIKPMPSIEPTKSMPAASLESAPPRPAWDKVDTIKATIESTLAVKAVPATSLMSVTERPIWDKVDTKVALYSSFLATSTPTAKPVAVIASVTAPDTHWDHFFKAKLFEKLSSSTKAKMLKSYIDQDALTARLVAYGAPDQANQVVLADFGTLPGELRNKIYGYIVEDTDVAIQWKRNPAGPLDYTVPQQGDALASIWGTPTLLRLCKESRSFALGYYKRAFNTTWTPGSVWFNHNDRVFINLAGIHQFAPLVGMMDKSDITRITRLALPLRDAHADYEALFRFASKFTALRTLDLFLSDSPADRKYGQDPKYRQLLVKWQARLDGQWKHRYQNLPKIMARGFPLVSYCFIDSLEAHFYGIDDLKWHVGEDRPTFRRHRGFGHLRG